jgi:hypothetical protein
MRSALYMRDAVALELGLELRRATPRGVLAPLVSQDLPRRSVVGDAARERLEHQHASLVMRHRKAHQISGVIIEERGHIDPLMPPQQERKEVRLPQLVRFGALEVLHLKLPSYPSLGCLRLDAFGSQHPPHRRLGGAKPQEPPHHIADPATAGSGRLSMRCQDRLRALIGWLLQVRVQRGPFDLECLLAALPIRLHPLDRRRVWHAQLVRYRKSRHPLFHHRAHHRLAHLCRPGSSPPRSFAVLVPRFARLAFCVHLSTPSLLLAQQSARQVLGDYAIITSRNRWFAAQLRRRSTSQVIGRCMARTQMGVQALCRIQSTMGQVQIWVGNPSQ